MPSTRDPILSLEPSNLLEPLDLADRYADSASSSARPERHASSPTKPARVQSAAAAISGHDAARGQRLPLYSGIGSQQTRRDSLSAPIERDGRWRLKSALLVMGALACVATGTALPQLAELPFGDVPPSQQTKSAQQQKTESIQRTITETTRQPAPVARQPASVTDGPPKSEESKTAESKPSDKPSESTSNGSNQSVALTANPGTQPALADQPAPATAQPAQDAAAGPAKSCGPRNKASDDKCLEGGLPEPAAGAARAVVPDRNSDGATTAPRTAGASPAKSRAAPQSIWEVDDRPQQSVNRRATQRETADQQATSDNNGQGTRSSDRNSLDRDRRQDQDSNRTSSRRRDRSGDNGQTARYGDGRQEQEVNRVSSGRRDRYDDDTRGEDRRVFGRAPREDDRVIGGPRYERPSIPIFGPLFGGGW